MSEQASISGREWFGAAGNSDNLGELDDLVAPGCVDHDPAPGQGSGAQGYREVFGELRTAFPDLHIEVEHLTDGQMTERLGRSDQVGVLIQAALA